MMKLALVFMGLISLLNSVAFAMGRGHALPDPEVVSQVDLDQYAGKWFEVAHSPNFFQRKCVSSTAEYQLLAPGKVSVYNTCFKANGSTSDIRGIAEVVDPAIPSKLKVRFNLFAKGDYWVTELDPNYQWAAVSSPGKKFTFILSRNAPIASDVLNQIIETLKSKGFDTDSFIFDRY